MRTLLWFSACFGVVTGFIEGVGLLAFHGLPWFKLNARIPEGVSSEIIWIAPVVSLIVFLIVSLVLAFLGRLFRLPILRIAFFVFPCLAIVDWLGLTERISVLGLLALAIGIATLAGRWMHARHSKLLPFAPKVLVFAGLLWVLVFISIEGGSRLRERIAAAHLPAARKTAPNVLVIVVDTLRADHLSMFGYSRPTSVHLDAIAGQGVVFENAISTSSWTLPAHQSFVTGRFPHEHGPLREQPLNPNYPTLAEKLDRYGYRTGGFSGNNDFFCHRAGFARGFLHFEDYFYSTGDMLYRTFWGRLLARDYVAKLIGRDELPARWTAAAINASALRWIDEDHGKPFFAFLNYFDVHSPYVPKPSYGDKFLNHDQRARCAPTFWQRINPLGRPDEFEQLMRLSAPCFQTQIDMYDDGISYVDDQIHDLFSQLAARGLDKTTLVVIASDHGESFREHGLVGHGTSLYRELLWVPLVYYWPGHLPAGIRIERPVSIASLPATILDLLGYPDTKDFPVSSLALLWQEPGADPDWPYPLSELAEDPVIPKQFPAYRGWMKSIIDPHWHLIVSQSDPPELYLYDKHRAESQNLVNSFEGKAVMNDVQAELWKQVTAAHPNQASLIGER